MVRYFRFARDFWFGKDRRPALLVTFALVALVVVQLVVAYRFNVWNRDIFNALEKKDAAAVTHQALLFLPLALASVAVAVLLVYVRMRTQRSWRAWMTDQLISHWLRKGRYYQLNFIAGDHTNPEHRIAEDTRVATEAPIDLATGILSAALTAATFVGVLWSVGGSLAITVGGKPLVIPGYLVIAVVMYCIVISTSMLIIARSFVPVTEMKNQAEAEFRFALSRVRENGESIAILGGETEERGMLASLLGNVVSQWANLARQYMRTQLVSHSNYIIASVIPIILCAPKYLGGRMTLGDVMQATAAFIQVQYAFNWLVDNYPRMAELTASASRVGTLIGALDDLDRMERSAGYILRTEGGTAALTLHELSVSLSDGTVVIDEADVDIDRGEKVLLTGASGTGKSTLVRAIAGLWPWGAGTIRLRPGTKIFLMPQRPYIPTGTLRRAATYPDGPETVSAARLSDALIATNLGHLIERLDDNVAWERALSGGEQQRLGFVRLILQAPDIAVMDEATSALDIEGQAMLMRLVHDRLPDMAIISVGHRPELEAFHERKLNLHRHLGGAQLTPGVIGNAPGGMVQRLFRRLRQLRPDWKRARGSGETPGPAAQTPPPPGAN